MKPNAATRVAYRAGTPGPEAKVTLSADKPETPEILAEAIVSISRGMTKLLASGLNRKAVVVLLKDASGVSQRDINTVLNALALLERNYCR